MDCYIVHIHTHCDAIQVQVISLGVVTVECFLSDADRSTDSWRVFL